MPLYEYLCVSCGLFEVHRPVVAAGKSARCPACNARADRQYIFNTSVTIQSEIQRAPAGPASPDSYPLMSGIQGAATLTNVGISGFGTGYEATEGESTLVDCVVAENRAGVSIRPGASVTSIRGTYSGNLDDVDNAGHFDSTDDVIS